MEDNNKLEATNRVLRDLERKLSLVLTVSLTTSAQSHGSVVQNLQYGGMARDSIQLSVINYIRNSGSDFDPNLVYSDVKKRLITKFDREYSPATGKSASADDLSSTSHIDAFESPPSRPTSSRSLAFMDSVASGLPRSSVSSNAESYNTFYDDNFDSYCESDTENDPTDPDNVLDSDDDMLLPPLPPRLPPKELDPNKLYGLFDFLGPDPLHCTLFREEPVYLINDLDNYWWLIRKMTKQERIIGNTTNEEIFSDEEDGKIGFVPAECLETHGERLARLNCYKNEVLEKKTSSASLISTHSVLPLANDLGEHNGDFSPPLIAIDETLEPLIRRKGSILKKKGEYKSNNKLVTFENLNEFVLDDEDEDEDEDDLDDVLSYRYYGLNHDDIKNTSVEDTERHSEVFSDIYPVNTPLHVSKNARDPVTSDRQLDLGVFAEPKLPASEDNNSIGTYSPDTPPSQRLGSLRAATEDSSELRRSVILDKLSEVTSLLSKETIAQDYKELSFGGTLTESGKPSTVATVITPTEKSEHPSILSQPIEGSENGENESLLEDLDSQQLMTEESSTPLTSANSLPLSGISPNLAPPEKKKRLKYETCLPVIGQLDELTRKLAEFENLLE